MGRYVAVTCLLLSSVPSLFAAETAESVIPLEIRDGRPVVRVFVNHHGPYRFLLDTGSTLNQLDPKIAASIGLTATFNTRLTSSTGVAHVSGTEGVELRVDATAADEQIVLLNSTDSLHQISPELDGVLGQMFLTRYNYLLDMRNKRLVLGASAAPMGTKVMFHLVAGRPVISTSLGALALDSGAHYLTRFGVRGFEDGRQMATASGTTSVGAITSRLAIAGRTFWRGEAITVSQSPETDVQGLLPITPFKAIYVSNSAKYLVLD
jgi:hypothetical protein